MVTPVIPNVDPRNILTLNFVTEIAGGAVNWISSGEDSKFVFFVTTSHSGF